MMKKCVALASVCLALAPVSAAFADPPFRTAATPGTRHYRYTSVERNPGQADARYRVDFDLVTDAKGGVTAVVRKADSARGETWTTPTVSSDCKASLRGAGQNLARVTLAPLSPEAAESLGEPFMSMCAPASYFFPMTDILNVVLVQTSPSFHINGLTSVGSSVRFDGFKTKLDRLNTAIVASSPGGSITLFSLDDHKAVVDWAPDPMNLTLTVHASGTMPEITMTGLERYAFRVEIDRSSGAMLRAATTSDNLDMIVNVANVPADKAPHVTISREVAIETREN